MDGLFKDTQFLLLLGVWFVFSYLVLWFIGGACFNPWNGSNCIASGSLDFLRNLPLIGLLFPFNQWVSLMHFFAPIAGFALAFVLLRWWNSYFETKEAFSVLVLLAFLIALFLGYYLNLFFYYNESAYFNSRNGVSYSLYFCISESTADACNSTVSRLNNEFISLAQKNNATTVSQFIPINYWGELRESIYLLFILGSISAWIFLFSKNFFDNINKAE
jgi:cation transport ATPase